MPPVLDKTDNLVGQQCAEGSLTLALTERARLSLMVLLLQMTAHPSQRTVTHHGKGCPTLVAGDHCMVAETDDLYWHKNALHTPPSLLTF